MARRGNRLVTMSDIAQMAGVSESTVSRALSGSPLVAERTRRRIADIARTTRFAVNEQARNLALGHTRTIEVLFPIEEGTLQHVGDPFFVDMLATLTDTLAQHGFDALLSKSAPWSEERPGCAFLSGRADGVLFIGQGRHSKDIRDFARNNRRVVTWGAVSDGDDTCVVGSDNVLGGRLATEHLFSLGRKRVAFLGDRGLAEIAQRYEGFCEAHRNASMEVDEALVVGAPFDIERAREKTDILPKMAGSYDGIVASSDMIALAAIASLRSAGIGVPRDVSVVGFDDVAMAAHVHPALTTVHQRIRYGGEIMIRKLLALMSGEEASSEKLPVRLIVRESCGGEPSSL